jgi:hypothetical protein
MKLTYPWKITLNINYGTTIHFTIVISLNKNINELKTLIDEKCNRLIKMNDELWIIIIDEIFF